MGVTNRVVVRWLGNGLFLVLVAAVVVAEVSGWLAWNLSRTYRLPLTETPADRGLAYEEVTFTSRAGGLILRGWLVPAEGSERLIIVVHGLGANRTDPGAGFGGLTADLVAHGYDVLAFDLRGHGESEGSHFTLGYLESFDLLAAIDYAKDRGFQPEHIGVLGASLGAATAILAAARTDDVAAVVADSAFASGLDFIELKLHDEMDLPRFFVPTTIGMGWLLFGANAYAAVPERVVADVAPRPILFIHGEDDGTIPVENAYRLHAAARNPAAELWVVPGVGHAGAYRAHREEYVARVTAFFGELCSCPLPVRVGKQGE